MLSNHDSNNGVPTHPRYSVGATNSFTPQCRKIGLVSRDLTPSTTKIITHRVFTCTSTILYSTPFTRIGLHHITRSLNFHPSHESTQILQEEG